MSTPNRTFDKQSLQEVMSRLERSLISAGEERFREFAKGANIDFTAVRDGQDGSQARQNTTLAAATVTQIHEHEGHDELLSQISFAPRSTVGAGAIVRINGRHFVVAVPSPVFAFEGVEMMGISLESPLASASEGLKAGDEFTLGQRHHVIEQVW